MEPALVASDSNWSSFAFEGIVSTEESEFMSQLFSNYPFPNEQDFDQNVSIPPSFSYEATTVMCGEGESLHYSYNNIALNPNSLHSWPHGSNTSLVNASDHVNYTLMDLCPEEDTNASSVDLFMLNEDMCGHEMGESGLNSSEEVVVPNQICSPKRKLQTPETDDSLIDRSATNQSENLKKKPRVSGHAQRSSKNGKAKKNRKLVQICEEADNATSLNRQSSSSYSSEDDSNASEEANGGSNALNLNGKTRASRGSATDPQSLYARKRRERINERLRILQNLVPNGTKVDISTMLEEAVQYVKFLQLQIKLLSSDDLWMYAPIAYNGMDIGLDLKISPR